MGKIKDFRELGVWRKAHLLVLKVYEITKDFPNEERFGLIQQMRRASISVPANIAEGFKKRSKKDKVNFYNIAQGSLEELRYYLILSNDLGYLKNLGNLDEHAEEIARMLNGLIKAVEGVVDSRSR